MPQVFYILFGATFTVATCLALGSLLVERLGLRLHRQEQPLFWFLAGAPCLSLLVFMLAAAGLVHKSVFLACGLAAIAAALWRLRGQAAAPCLPALPRLWRVVFGVVFAVFALLYLINAMAPEASADGSAYHLGLAARYLREHGFRRLTTNMYANLSQGVEMLFLFAFAFGRHSAAALVHAAFLIALPLSMLCYGRRFGFPAAGATGALLAFASPVMGVDGTSAYIDVAVAAILFGLFYLLEIWDRERTPALLALIGLLAGFAYAAKYTAFLAVPFALGFVLWRLLRARQPLIRPLATVAACVLLMMVPWMAKNALWLNNPFSPFLNRLFPNPYVHVSFEEEYVRMMQNYGELPSRWKIPYELTVRGEALCGLLGPVFLLAPLALAALRFQAGRRLLAAGALFALPYYANIGTRFLIPAVPFLALAMGLAFSAWDKLAAALVLMHALASWPACMGRYCGPWAWRLKGVPIRQALRLEPEEADLARRHSGYVLARFIEKKVPRGAKVFSFGSLPEAYTTRDILVGYQAAFNNVISDILLTPLVRESPPTQRWAFQFKAAPVEKVRVVQTARGRGLWSVSELRVSLKGIELPRSYVWRLRASPNPTDVQLAFDGSPATRWRSWQSIAPGMFLEVDFGRSETVDSVVLDCSPEQEEVRLRLEGQDRSGVWRTLAEAPHAFELPPPLGLGRMAMREVKAQGIDFLVVGDTDFGAADFRKNAALWGLKPLGQRGPATLYELEIP